MAVKKIIKNNEKTNSTIEVVEKKEDKNNIIYPIEENEIGDFEKSFLDNYYDF